MAKKDPVREQVIALLRGGNAHLGFEDAIQDLPAKLRDVKPQGLPHSAWELLEHMRIAQWDILEFSRNPKHVSPAWPEGYWPDTESPPKSTAWSQSVRTFRADLKAMMDLVADPGRDLVARIPHGQGQTLLREALLVADHNSYHLGQLVMIRRLLGEWKG